MSASILDRLYNILEQRKSADPQKSYVASLYQRGTEAIARKVGEESMEAVIEALQGDKEKLTEESADLLFHLLVLWAHLGLRPEEVMTVLERRLGTNGFDEKAARRIAD